MKLLITTFESPATSGGGLSTYIRNILPAHKQCGDEIVILAQNEDIQKSHCKKSGNIEIVEFNPLLDNSFQKMGYWPAVSYAFSNKIKEIVERGFIPDWVEFPDGFGLGYFSLQRRLTLEEPFKDIPMLVTTHCPTTFIDELDNKNIQELPTSFLQEMEKFCIKAADKVISPSQYHADVLKKKWFPQDVDGDAEINIDIVHNPFYCEEHKKKEKRDLFFGFDMSVPVYAVVSRVSFIKGVPQLVEGFDLYWSRGGKSKLHIFGADVIGPDGKFMADDLTNKYKEYISDGRLVFRGLERHVVIMEEKKNIRALFHPSLHESFAYAVVEHMAVGGVVAVGKTGGHIEFIEADQNAFIFDQFDKESICSTIIKLDALTPAQIKSIGEKASETIAREASLDRYLREKKAILRRKITLSHSFPFVSGKVSVFDRGPCHEKDIPLLSVIIPHFNLGNLIKETVSSVLACDHPSYEIVIVDDGSTKEDSRAVIDTIEKWGERVRVIRKENSGVADTRNVGVKAARGRYIALLDADDLVERDYYSRATQILDHYDNVGFVGCWNNDFDELGIIRTWTTFNPEMPRQLIFNTTNCAGIVVRRDAYLKYAQHDPHLKMFLDDWESTIALMCAGVRGVMIPHGLFNYRVRSGSLFRDKRYLWKPNYEYIVGKHIVSYQKYAKEIIIFLNANGPNTDYHNPTFPPHPSEYVRLGTGGRLDQMARWYYKFVLTTKKGRQFRSKFHILIELFAVTAFFSVKQAVKLFRNSSKKK